MVTVKKKFPLPRPRSRKPSVDLDSVPAAIGGVDGSERSRSLTPRRSFGRKPSFKFSSLRKSKKDSPKADHGDDCDGSSICSDSPEDETFVNQLFPPPPLPLPTTVVGSAVNSDVVLVDVTKNNQQPLASSIEPQQSSSPTPLPRTRSLTPSDYHYHTAPQGGCNAPLTPISHHYQTNDALLDLFSTLYEKDQFSVAYAVGVKFVEVALFTIPNHGYYKSGSYSKKRTKSAADAVRVTKLLGGFLDEMEDDNEEGGIGGLEKIETLDRLANVAHQSFEEALDYELKGNIGNEQERRDQDAANTTSQVSRIWKDYIMGGGDDGSSESNKMCSLFPVDTICSFWNLGACNNAVDDAVPMDYHERHVKKRQKFEEVDPKLLPGPVVIPQVFIKKPEKKSAAVEKKDATHGGDATEVVYRSDKYSTVAKKVSDSSADSSDSHREVVIGDEAAEEAAAGTKPMEVDLEEVPKKSHSSDSNKANNAIDGHQFRGESPPSILTEPGEDTPMVDGYYETKPVAMQPEVVKPVVVKGTPIEPVDSAGFDTDALQLALSLSMSMQDTNTAAVIVSSSSEDIPNEQPNNVNKINGVVSLSSLYEEQYHSLRNKNKFHVRFLDTFQGRNPNSTNGCTVIAPLTCIQYFTSNEQNTVSLDDSSTWNNGIPDELINQVIDEHAAAVLPEVRNKLHLEGDSFIIPSDVHDHLIEVGLLHTSQFVGVCGGNILDDDHLSAFKSSLLLLEDGGERERLKGRKVAATFFFHGHVVALHVVDGGGGGEGGDNVWIELIDSLPNPETWVERQQQPPSRVSSDSMDCEEREEEQPSQPATRWSGSTDGEWEHPIHYEYDDELPQNAVRVRCTDVEHFDTLLRHYACSKFSMEEQLFIDSTLWEDCNSYCESAFDPRIFQAFIWAEAA